MTYTPELFERIKRGWFFSCWKTETTRFLKKLDSVRILSRLTKKVFQENLPFCLTVQTNQGGRVV